MNSKFKAFFVGSPLTALYILSFKRNEYIREIVHIECNAALKGFFNKTETAKGWKCVQNGEVVHTVQVKASMIPSPLELTAGILAIVCVAVWTYVFWYLIQPSLRGGEE